MRLFTALSFFVVLISCQPPISEKSSPIDSLGGKSVSEVRAHLADSMSKAFYSEVYVGDTSNLSTSPVEIISFQPVEGERGKNISITYKNISTNPIAAIKFTWYGLDAFGDGADVGADKGYGSGITEETVNPGETKTIVFSVESKRLKRLVNIWPYEVAFEDGAQWRAKK